MASCDSDRDALAKLLQMGMVAEYQSQGDNFRTTFSLAHITEARFEEENNQAADNNDDEESKNVEDQQVSEAEDDTNNDDFGCLLPPHKGAEIIVEE
ncbi:hypothetical protein Tco_1432272, partial [Tanacetum coccineum]